MGCCGKLAFLAVTLVAIFGGLCVKNLFEYKEAPKLEETYWGPGAPGREDVSINPFKIAVSDDVLNDLKRRLETHRPLTPPLEGTKQEYGMNTNLLKLIGEYWKTNYKWRERENFLNQFPQFTTKIQGLKIHFLHVKPENKENKKVLPLLLLHGWPGSVREFYETIPYLTKPRDNQDFVFEVIAPSLPGYGFSEGASRPGLGAVETSVIFKNLMKRLGYEKFYVQGGDWGSLIASNMAAVYPERIMGIHTNMCAVNTLLATIKVVIGSFYPPLVAEEQNVDKMYPLSKTFSKLIQESGYFHEQATKPDTIGVALNDSPIGLLAYILEKFSTWTEPAFLNRTDAGLSLKFKYHDLIDNVMLYWVTGSITTSMRMYANSFSKAQFGYELDRVPITVPSACAKFSNELFYQSDFILQEKYTNLVHTADYIGGHFAAFELPKVFADDVWTAVSKMEKLRKPKSK